MKNFKLKGLKKWWVFVFYFAISNSIEAQPFANEIAAFKKSDSIHFPAKNQILFIGSSSFTKWKDVQNYFIGYAILNRGFGGSTLIDVIRYKNEIITAYSPKQIVMYCGENDIASSDTITTNIVVERFKTLFKAIRKQYPTIPFAFISIKPSPARWLMKERMIIANKKIKNFLKKQTKTKYINVWDKMLNKDGLPMEDIFIEDKLHMNAKGYQIWQKAITPILLK